MRCCCKAFVPTPVCLSLDLPACWDYVHFMKREGTPVLGIPFMWVFLPFVVLLLALVVRCAFGMWRAWQGLDLEDAGVPS